MGSFKSSNSVLGGNLVPFRSKYYVFSDDFARETLTPSGWPTWYTAAETGAGGTSNFDTNVCRILLVTDANAGDDQDLRTSGFKIDRAYPSLITGMTKLDKQTTSVQVELPFSVTSAADIEGFIGLHNTVGALTALPTTSRHMGLYWDISAGANFMLTSSNGTTQVTTDTTIAVDTAIHILRIIWTGEDAATLQLLTAAGANEGTGQTITALNGSSANNYQVHWFVQTETTAAKTMRVYPWQMFWT